MRTKASILLIALVAVAYVSALAIVDGERTVFARLTDVAAVMPILLTASLVAYGLRAVRWSMLLAVLGHRVPFPKVVLGYVAGFAFTASPGKAGELVRIRYFSWHGAPASHVVAAFVFERMLDLAVLLVFASVLAGSANGFGLAVLLVAILLSVIVAVARWPRVRYRLQHLFRTLGLRLLARIVRIVFRGVEQTSVFLPARHLVPATLLACLAWGAQCIGYALTLSVLGIDLPAWVLFAVPPTAVLIGAASLLPGGIGSTEAATVMLLAHFGVALSTAVLASIAIRLGSIWFATMLGFGALIWLEAQRHQAGEEAAALRWRPHGSIARVL